MKRILASIAGLIILILLVVFFSSMQKKEPTSPPMPLEKNMAGKDDKIAVLAGGCFWGIEGVYERLNGVKEVIPGYAGGSQETATYNTVSSGSTQHAESVYILYDPKLISYKTILKVFFTVAHDPTQLNYQGPDKGYQYRSALFYTDTEQQRTAEEYIEQLNREKVFAGDIVTQVVPLTEFYPAEEYHQDFIARNPDYPYVVFWDIPKINHLLQTYPELIKKEYLPK
ncbi:MAG: peptide-methionine (S)-S-oxide reductase MsrA [Spirochaetales bacterium]|nr:peptide-methionine (S)-S-oxide reductase MsrA [Spirochaetales bacterium]